MTAVCYVAIMRTDWLEPPKYYLKAIFLELRDRPVFLWAQAIGFKVLITIVPLIILATGLVAQLLRRERPFLVVESAIRDILPAYQSSELISFLSQLQSVAGRLTIVGSFGLLVTAVTLFTTLRIVLSSVFQEDWHKQRSILRGYAFDLRMAIQVGLLFTASILLTVVAQTINTSVFWGLSEIGVDASGLQSGWMHVVDVLGLILPYLVSLTMFFQLLYFTPLPHPRWKSAATGAMVAAIMWEGAKVGFSEYATRLGSFEQSGLAALGDSFVLIIILVFWAYFSGLVLAIGAITCMIHERRHRSP